ncbi:MAG: HDIG domain-containing protein [Proteobacteria bacterium]|nr:HDIG domain-containing protein [Pseudomonadota bacterium]
MTRDEAYKILSDKIKNKNLLKHMLAVEAIMEDLAEYFNEDKKKWGICGLLHDFDYEETLNNFENHGKVTEERFRDTLEEDILYAIRAHTGLVERKSPMDKAIYCADPVSGFIVAATLVIPSRKIADIKVENLLNRFKEKHFAKGASREQMMASEELGLSLEKFFQIALTAMNRISKELGL